MAAYCNEAVSGASGSFSVRVASLTAGTTYYYRAAMQVGDRDFYGDVLSFTTAAAATTGPSVAKWLEMPAVSAADLESTSEKVFEELGRGSTRNYTHLYDKSMYASLWSAYPLTATHLSGSANSSNWIFDPNIPSASQIDVRKSSYPSNFNNADDYTRGHLVPAADRKCDAERRSQLYYLTNQVPQIGNSFNGSVWGNLEEDVRKLTSSTDTVYVVTGVCYKKVGGNETIKYLTKQSGSSVTQNSVPVPNYFYKVLLKVNRSGSGAAKTVTAASAIGFWFEHKEYPDGTPYTSYVYSVDQIESWTGMDFFVNLPDGLESSAETNTSWSTFQDF